MLIQGKADKIYLRKRILKAGLDKNGYYWNKEALESLVRDFHQARAPKVIALGTENNPATQEQIEQKKKEMENIPQKQCFVKIPKDGGIAIGEIVDVAIEEVNRDRCYLQALIELDKGSLETVNVTMDDIAKMKVGGCVKITYDLTEAEVFCQLAFDDTDEPKKE